MTIIEAINYIDNLKPNDYSQSEKISWLSQLDGRVKLDIIDTHEGAEGVVFEGYNVEAALDTELLIPAPYTEVYTYWLEGKIDYANGEYTKYNNSMSMFNTAYSAYENYYNRTHMPLGKKINFFANAPGNSATTPSTKPSKNTLTSTSDGNGNVTIYFA